MKRSKSAVRLCVASVTAVGGFAAVATPAMASGGGKISPYIGGYLVAPSEGITSVSTTFRIPKETCPNSNDETDLFVGLDLTQTSNGGFVPGNDQSNAQIDFDCAGGVPHFQADVRVGSDYGSPNNDIAAGDVIQTRIVETPSGNTIATAYDLTSGAQDTVNSTSAPAPFTPNADVIGAEDASAIGSSGPDIGQFSKVTFKNTEVGGLDWNRISPTPTAYALNQDGDSNTNQLIPSAIPTKPSTTFTLTEKRDD